MKARRLLAAIAVAAVAIAVATAGGRLIADAAGLRDELLAVPLSPNLGGDGSRAVGGDKAFTFFAANAPADQHRAFFFGNRVFNTNWVPYPADVPIFDGLGPTFNRDSCSGCHAHDGRGRPPDPGQPMESMLIRLSSPTSDPGGRPGPEPAYGDQLNDHAIPGVPAEGRATVAYDEVPETYGDGTPYTLLRPHYHFADLAFGPLDDALVSPRVAPAMIGLGLLEAVPLSTLEALADDHGSDGVAGKINWITGPDGQRVAGRFGWKANVATLREQAASAAHDDMGLTTSLYPQQNCPPAQTACAAAPAQPDAEMSADFLDDLVTYVRILAVPAERNSDGPMIVRGERLFRSFGCAACHIPTLRTGDDAELPELRDQTIHPFTDLLIHDMGDGLADGRPDHSASGRQWRTAPLWGLGLIQTVNGHDRLLHDGRARGAAEAILWHGGEAERSREMFRTATAADRDALIAFLNSL